jgi:hypothetical protein
MGKTKRDSDPTNDYSDGRSAGLRYVARRMGVKVSDLIKKLKRTKK